MKALLNHEIIDLGDLRLSQENRGFSYGDGFFETISIINGVPRFLDKHLNRLHAAAEQLKFEALDILDFEKIIKGMEILQELNNMKQHAKLKLMMWRNSQGLYSPDRGKPDILMTLSPLEIPGLVIIDKVGISDDIVNFPSPFSRFKTMSAIKYVMAGIEKKEKNLDEIILLDWRGFISEALVSNIFWKKDNTYYTPPLSTGCIDGIMRAWLTEELKSRGYDVLEKLSKTSEFMDAESIFTTNALGIGHIRSIEKMNYIVDEISQEIIETIS